MTNYILGGGCFWCLDAVYRMLKGVTQVESGYAGGSTSDPDYTSVSSGTTGHAEVVRVEFDETVIPPSIILDAFFTIHDPTTLNRQGADVGTQYRSIMLYQSPEQKETFEKAADRARNLWDKPLVTEIVPLSKFYPAEREHQDYYSRQPGAGYCQVVIRPKVDKVAQSFRDYLE